MLGHKVVQRLSSRFSDLWWTLRGTAADNALAPVPILSGDHAIPLVDATKVGAIEELLRDLRPAVVVNCLGVIKQRAEASSEQLSMAINAALPHQIARTLSGWAGRFIQVGTDCVFSGARGGYREEDAPDPIDLYGRSKALGEVRAENALTLRTSLIGRELRHHQSLLDWFLAKRGQRILGFRQVYWSGVTASHFADLLGDLIESHPALSGLYHVSSGRMSKFELLETLRDSYDLDVMIDPDDAVRIDRSLVGTRFEQATGYQCPPWSVLAAELVSDPTPYVALGSPVRDARDLR
jgi:dTDP-4-dehydrorhamnose reductase